MREWVVLALVAGLVIRLVATAADGMPGYVVDNGIAFGVYANRDWRGVAGTLNPVVEKAAAPRGPVPSRDRSFFIWTKQCQPGQRVAFERTVEFLGRPFTLGGFTQTGLDVKTWDIYFNGTRVAHLLKRVQPRFTTAHRKLLKVGDNTIRYEVQLSDAADACVEDSRAGRRGVWFSLTGSNATDISVTRPPRKHVFQHGRAHLQPIDVANRGLAFATEAVLTIEMASHVACLERNPDNTCKNWMFDVDVPVTDIRCQRVVGADPHDKRALECRIRNLAPREVRTVQVRMSFDRQPGAPDWVKQENVLEWEVKVAPGAVGESKLGNNSGELHVTYCQYGVRPGRCKARG